MTIEQRSPAGPWAGDKDHLRRGRLPIGAECMEGGVHFRVCATRALRVSVILEGDPGPWEHELQPEGDGYHSGLVPGAEAGSRYRYRLDSGDPVPDPVSRFQPDGPHGASQVVDPATFRWSDAGWEGPARQGQVFYELHVGTFTRAGTFNAASEHLPYLAELGITVIELLPLGEFAGRFGWGYDGVQLFAPFHHYGTPDDLRRFVDRAHALGLAVVLDVVYNHLGPDGNYLQQFIGTLESRSHSSDWGASLNFDGAGSGPVREYVLSNVRHWISEYHLDGLRIDATQDIHDSSPDHIIAAIVREGREAAGMRRLLITLENEPQNAGMVRGTEAGGFGADMIWNDDFHHSAIVALTGRREAYLSDYDGSARELGAAARWGFLYQGQWYGWQRQARGTNALDIEPRHFVAFLENHDQVANLARGQRVHQLAAPSRWRAMTSLLLLGPSTPLLFQGQEFRASSPFHYFADHESGLAERVRRGRLEFLQQFPRTRGAGNALIPDPGAEATFSQCVLDHDERALNAPSLALRRSHTAIGSARRPEYTAFTEDLLFLRWLSGGAEDRLLAVNLGRTLRLVTPSDPLLAPPAASRWRVVWTSEQSAYGGDGTPSLFPDESGPWTVPAECTLLLAPEYQ